MDWIAFWPELLGLATAPLCYVAMLLIVRRIERNNRIYHKKCFERLREVIRQDAEAGL